MLDTNIVSQLLRKHPQVMRHVVAAPITSLCISAITHAELLFGLARKPEATGLHAAVQELLRRVDTMPWDSAAAGAHGQARADLQRRGLALSPMDMLIGAHALSLQATLVSNDRAFAALAGLVLVDWTVAA